MLQIINQCDNLDSKKLTQKKNEFPAATVPFGSHIRNSPNRTKFENHMYKRLFRIWFSLEFGEELGFQFNDKMKTNPNAKVPKDKTPKIENGYQIYTERILTVFFLVFVLFFVIEWEKIVLQHFKTVVTQKNWFWTLFVLTERHQ